MLGHSTESMSERYKMIAALIGKSWRYSYVKNRDDSYHEIALFFTWRFGDILRRKIFQQLHNVTERVLLHK